MSGWKIATTQEKHLRLPLKTRGFRNDTNIFGLFELVSEGE